MLPPWHIEEHVVAALPFTEEKSDPGDGKKKEPYNYQIYV